MVVTRRQAAATSASVTASNDVDEKKTEDEYTNGKSKVFISQRQPSGLVTAGSRLLYVSMLLNAALAFMLVGNPIGTQLKRLSSEEVSTLSSEEVSSITNNGSFEPPSREIYTNDQIRAHLRCDEYFNDGNLPIYGVETYKAMRAAYNEIVGQESNFTLGSPDSDWDGFSVPYYVDYNKHGRGLYANADIPKGTLVYSSLRTAVFTDYAQYREFVMRWDRELTCDLTMWAYYDDDRDALVIDIDGGGFCNEGGEDHNIDYDNALSEKYLARPEQQFFATKDIKAGEEILCNYASFSYSDWSDWYVQDEEDDDSYDDE